MSNERWLDGRRYLDRFAIVDAKGTHKLVNLWIPVHLYNTQASDSEKEQWGGEDLKWAVKYFVEPVRHCVIFLHTWTNRGLLGIWAHRTYRR